MSKTTPKTVDFFTLVNSLEKTEKLQLRERILNATGATKPTWYYWLTNKKVGTPAKKLISLELNQPIEILFPNN